MEETTVRLMHYDPRWPQEFEQTRSSVLQSCQGWVTAVEHIGSTAISGLIAQPVIDMLAGVDEDTDLPTASLSIEGLNYREVECPPWTHATRTLTLQKPRHGQPTHRLFLMRRNSAPWQRAIKLREWLRNHHEMAIRFEETKVARWRDVNGKPDRYEADKSLFFAHLEDQIDAGESS